MRAHTSLMKDIPKRNHLHKKSASIVHQHRCTAQPGYQQDLQMPLSPSKRTAKHHKFAASNRNRNVAACSSSNNEEVSLDPLRVGQEEEREAMRAKSEHSLVMDSLNLHLENLTVQSTAHIKRKTLDNDHYPPDPRSGDVTVDELASYFENFVYIPRKMSAMAEMMYT